MILHCTKKEWCKLEGILSQGFTTETTYTYPNFWCYVSDATHEQLFVIAGKFQIDEERKRLSPVLKEIAETETPSHVKENASKP